MARNSEKIKHSNDNIRSLDPVQELKVIDLGMVDSRLSSTAKVLWHRLVRWANNDDGNHLKGSTWAGREKLAEMIGRSERTVSTCTKELLEVGLIVVQRRWDNTSLVRLNWEVIDRLASDGKKAARLHVKKAARLDVKKAAPYSTDLDSTERDSTIPSASHRSRTDEDQDGRSDDRKRYRQGKAEAEQTFGRLKRMPWLTESDDPDYQPSPEAHGAALIHYHRLLKAGIAAGRIEKAAVKFLAECPDNQRPCLASFLARYASDYFEFDPSQPEKFVPDECPAMNDNDQPAAAVNDNVQPPERKAVGGSWVSGGPCEEDAPF